MDIETLAPLPCIHGPTASGKSRLAYAAAERHTQRTGQPVEIISMDSAQVYRHLNLGTAKPSPQERAALVHHLIDVCEPEEHYSVAEFCSAAAQAAAEIRSRGHLPLLVGGTSMYLHALRQGLSDLPEIPAEVRQQVAAEAAERGWPAMHAALAERDPAAAARLEPNDRQRIGRCLEVLRHTGESLLVWQARGQRPGMPVAVLALMPQDRAGLHARIAERFEAMVASGLLDEVAALRQRPGLTANHPSMRCVGYRQAWMALDAMDANASAAQGRSLQMLPWTTWGVEATRQLAKRQITWLRRFAAEDPEMLVLDPGTQPREADADPLTETASNWLLAVAARGTTSPIR